MLEFLLYVLRNQLTRSDITCRLSRMPLSAILHCRNNSLFSISSFDFLVVFCVLFVVFCLAIFILFIHYGRSSR